MSTIDYLTKDAIVPNGQNYCCMSLFMNEDKTTILHIKVAGAFKTIEEGQEQIQLLSKPGHYNFVAEVGTWNAFDPQINNGDMNQQLNNMMKNYLTMMHKKNYDYDKRKYEMVIKNLNDNINIKREELSQYENDEEQSRRIDEQINSQLKKIAEYQEKLDDVNKNLSNIVIENKYYKNNDDNSVSQNVPVKYNGSVKRTSEIVPLQNWYCISFLTDTNTSLVGIKISGCFETSEQANSHSLALRDINDSFNVMVGKLYEWCPFNPDPDSVEAGESEYANPQLNETMKKKKENEMKAKIFQEYQKNEAIKKNFENLINEKKELQKDVNRKDDKSLEEQIQQLENKYKEYEFKEQEFVQQLQNNMSDPKLPNFSPLDKNFNF